MSNNTNNNNELVQREKTIIKTSLVGIAANVILSGLKAMVGFVSGSIAIILDAVNNLSDALSSVVTIVGTYLAGKRPDKKHPLGHGRIEYLSAMVVAVIVLYAGITAFIESVKHIINPTVAHYDTPSLIVIMAAIIVKIALGTFYNRMAHVTSSASLKASGQDALFDAVISVSVLASAIVYMTSGISLEAYVGIIISIFIIKAGIEILLDTASDILGRRADPELTRTIKAILNEEPEVRGAYDLIINNYGPEKNYASVHLELPDTMTVDEVDKLTRHVQNRVYMQTGVILTGVGVYSYNTSNDEAARIRNAVQETILAHDFALQMHGFYLDMESKEMRFDVVFSFDIDYEKGLGILYEDMRHKYPEYQVTISPDVDISD
ncbi:MAG: cation diffusion facilitator family transporter [Lachnospiraceae bacterium]|nr:cation diffusion facilitator family transporter [Lachnospiraceae bacterium]